MEVKFKINVKTVKQGFALLGIDIPSDEEIESKLSKCVLDLSDSDDADIKAAELGFVLMAIGQAFSD